MLRVEAAALARPCKYQAKSKDAGVWTPPPLPPVAIAALAHSVYRAFRLRLATAVHSDVTRSFGPQQLPCPGRGAAPQGRSRPSSRALVVRCRPGTVRVCGGPGSAVHRSTSLRAAPRPGHPIASDAFVALFTFQTAQIFSFPRRMSASGVCIVASLTRKEGGRSAERRSGGQRNTREARRIAARQALASLALRTVFARLFSQPRRKARMSHQKVSAKLPTEFRGGAA